MTDRVQGKALAFDRTAIACLVLACAIAAALCLPLFGGYWFESHDMAAYPIRTVEYVAGWRTGQLFPRWAPDLYGGYGAPLFCFYPPLLFAFSGALVLIGVGPTLALKLVLVLISMAGAGATFLLLRRLARRDDAALLGAVVFAFMPYRMIQLFTRGDLAEYAATCLVPVSLWLYHRIWRIAPAERLAPRVLAAAAMHATVLGTHTLTGLWHTLLLAPLALPSALRVLRREAERRDWGLCLALGASCALAAIYALPALFERDLVHIARMTEGGLATPQNGVELKWLLEPEFFYLGWAIAVFLVAAPILVALRRSDARARPLLAVWAITLVLVLLMWKRLGIAWSYLPFGAFMQFPWRLLAFAAVGGSLVAGLAWSLLFTERRPWRWAALLPVLALVAWTSSWGNRVHAKPIGPELVPSTAEEIRRGIHSTVISDEYLPRWASRPPGNRQVRYANAAQGDANIETALGAGTRYRFTVAASAGAALDVNTYYYPGWRIVNAQGPAPPRLVPSPAGLNRVELPAAGTYRFELRFGTTWLRSASALMSWLTLLALIGWVIRERRRARADLGR